MCCVCMVETGRERKEKAGATATQVEGTAGVHFSVECGVLVMGSASYAFCEVNILSFSIFLLCYVVTKWCCILT